MNKAMLFPGQGSQSLGMLGDWADTELVKQTFDTASNALGYDLSAVIQSGPEERLNQTSVTQPAILTTSVALWHLYLDSHAEMPTLMAGHSLGEYSALVCAGVMDFATAVKLVEQRGLYMQQAVPAGTGGMAAIIGLADDAIAQACSEAAQGEVVSAVNFNSPGQVVIAGHKAAVERASVLCKETGAKRALPLAVSVPSHCALMQPAADKLAELLAPIELAAGRVPVINNVDVAQESDPAKIKDALRRQLFSPVRWTETVQLLADQGIEQAAEIGPGKVLTGLAKRIDKRLKCVSVSQPAAVATIWQ